MGTGYRVCMTLWEPKQINYLPYSPLILFFFIKFVLRNLLGSTSLSRDLAKYISAEESCDWTGKREVELRVAETESIPEKRARKMAAVNQHGYDWPQETLG